MDNNSSKSSSPDNIIEIEGFAKSNPIEDTSNCNGYTKCSCNHNHYSNACGCSSHFDGEKKEQSFIEKITPYFGIVTPLLMTGAIIYLIAKSNKNDY